jgi:hypothetical protein
VRPIEIVSLDFLTLGLVTLAVYYFLPHRAQAFWLLSVSYFFYATWNPLYPLVLLFLTILNFNLALQIEKTQSRILLIVGVGINVISFTLLKIFSGPYGQDVIGKTDLTSVLLPIGFSFYLLQIISYLIDVSRGQIKPEQQFSHFALYIAYFPKMLAGPIERAKDFLPQLKRERIVDQSAIEQGLYLLLLGMIRKIVIADHLALLRPADIFSASQNYLPYERAIWLLVFAFTIYNDFAGYTSIVRGVSNLMGIELSPNFRQPFLARSFSDFWARWHITLSEWLKDYIFYPVRRWLMSIPANRWLVLLLPPLITMLTSGFWHGASLALITWGLAHASFLIVEQLLQQVGLLPKKGWMTYAYGIFVFFSVTLAWIPFNTPSVRGAARFLSNFTSQPNRSFDLMNLPDILILVLLSFWMDRQEVRNADPAFPRNWTVSRQAWGVAFAILLLLLFTGTGTDLSRFVYQGY